MKKLTKNKFLMLLPMFLLWNGAVHAQNVNIHFSYGTNISYNLEDVRKITFQGDEMILLLWDETVYSWNVSTVNYYEYDGVPNSVEELSRNSDALQVQLFPNPTKEALNVRFYVSEADEFTISLIDLSGKLLIERDLGNRGAGYYLETIDMKALSPGNYICRISGKEISSSQKVIKQ